MIETSEFKSANKEINEVVVNEYTNKFTAKFINDPIYGGIGLSQLEVDIINTPVFQRLRGLRQLAFVSYIFPGAEHSRFVHSLGVLYIMGKMTDHLNVRYPNIVTEQDRIKLRLAALLHDIGHYPLSHLGEGVYCYKQNLGNLSKYATKKESNKIEPSLLSTVASKQKKSAHHEQLGKYIIENHNEIKTILENVGVNPSQIGDLIVGSPDPERLVYSQLLHSSLDADRLDYLLRDSFQTGVRYGLVDLDYIIRLLCIGKDNIRFDNDILETNVLACNKKGKHVIEHFLMSRYFHYSQVISHKTSLAFESVAKAMFYKLIDKDKFIFNSYQEIKDNINNDKFLEFTDDTLMSHLKAAYSELDSDFRVFYDMINNRNRPRTLIDLKDLGDRREGKASAFNYRELLKTLKKNPQIIVDLIGVPAEHVGYQEMQVYVETIPTVVGVNNEERDKYDKDLREAVRIIDTHTGEVSLLVEDKESIINRLADLSSNSLRVFYIEPDTWENPEEKCSEAKEKLEDLLNEDS